MKLLRDDGHSSANGAACLDGERANTDYGAGGNFDGLSNHDVVTNVMFHGKHSSTPENAR